MSNYILRFSEQAKDDIRLHKKSGNKSFVNKITLLLEELVLHPFTGTGKPETLKHALTGCWSRRINREHRLIYEVADDAILSYLLRGIIFENTKGTQLVYLLNVIFVYVMHSPFRLRLRLRLCDAKF